MKQIKICKKNSVAIEALLSDANGKATSFAIIEYEEVEKLAAKAEGQLEEILIKKDRAGASSLIVGRGPTASSYRYPVATTQLTLSRRATGWFLADAAKVVVYPKSPERVSVKITTEQASIAGARFETRLTNDFGVPSSEGNNDEV